MPIFVKFVYPIALQFKLGTARRLRQRCLGSAVRVVRHCRQSNATDTYLEGRDPLISEPNALHVSSSVDAGDWLAF